MYFLVKLTKIMKKLSKLLLLHSLCFIHSLPQGLLPFLLPLFKCLQNLPIVSIRTPDLVRALQNMMDLAV